MTSDELRRLAAEACPGRWAVLEPEDFGEGVTVVNDDEDVVCEAFRRDARLIAALGPDAACLLADAMDALQTASDCCARPYGVCCEWIELQARFAALGDPS